MNDTNMDNYFSTIINTPVTPYNISTEEPDIHIALRKIHQSQLFLVGLLFMMVVILAVMSVKLYRRIFNICVPFAYPGAAPLQEEDVEEIVVYSNDIEEIAVPVFQIEVDAENNVISEETALKKNK